MHEWPDYAINVLINGHVETMHFGTLRDAWVAFDTLRTMPGVWLAEVYDRDDKLIAEYQKER